jgi:hypothetical protein
LKEKKRLTVFFPKRPFRFFLKISPLGTSTSLPLAGSFFSGFFSVFFPSSFFSSALGVATVFVGLTELEESEPVESVSVPSVESVSVPVLDPVPEVPVPVDSVPVPVLVPVPVVPVVPVVLE